MADWFDGNGSGEALDVAKLLDSEAGNGLHHLVGAGALVSMGLTSDGGALGVTVTVDGRWRREYFRNEEDLLAWIAEAIPATPPHTPRAVLRSLPSLKLVVRIESAAGSVIAAPRPCARRAPTSTPELPASPPISDETPIRITPEIKILRRPSRSAARPPSSMNPP